MTWSEFLSGRVQWATAGSAGGHMRTKFGPVKIPSGAKKSFAAAVFRRDEVIEPAKQAVFAPASKGDEAGVDRTLLALALDSLWPELYAWSPIFSGVSAGGLDVNESAAVQAHRHMELLRMVQGPGWIEAFDWKAFDHWATHFELSTVSTMLEETMRMHMPLHWIECRDNGIWDCVHRSHREQYVRYS